MKSCIYCGYSMNDDARFCSCCGAASQNVSGNLSERNDIPPRNAITVENYFRGLCTSRLGISFTIVACLQWLITLCTAFWPIQALGLDDEVIREMIDLKQFSGFFSITMLISMVPSTVILVGILMTAVRAFRPTAVPNKGGTRLITILFKVMRIAYPVLLGLASFALISACSKFGTTYYGYANVPHIGTDPAAVYLDENAVTVIRAAMGIVVLVLWGGCVFSVFYYHKVVSTLESITTSVELNRPIAKISMFVIVMCFVSGGLSALNALGGGLIVLVLDGLNAAMQILAGFILLSIRKNISLPAKFHAGV